MVFAIGLVVACIRIIPDTVYRGVVSNIACGLVMPDMRERIDIDTYVDYMYCIVYSKHTLCMNCIGFDN